MKGTGDGEPTGPLTTPQIARRLLPLYVTHVNQAILTTMPFTLAVYMVRNIEAAKAGGDPAAVSEAVVGRATGILSAVFCAAQLLTSYPLGMLSDRIGRKPVMVLGNISSVLSVAAFGLSGSYAQAVAARAVGGAMNAVILCAKAIIGEGLPDKPAQAKGFGLLGLCWGVGSLAGPMIGGSLSAPCSTALRVDALCGEGSLLVHRPYFLPCLLAALLSVISTVMVIVSLEETRPRRRSGSGQAGWQQYEPVPASDDAAEGGSIRGGAAAGAAAAGGRGEVELGGIKHTDGSSGSRGGQQVGDGTAMSEEAAVASISGSDRRPFCDDSAQPSPPDGASLPQQQGRAAKQQPGAQQGPAADGVSSSRGDADSDDIVVYWPEDLERGGLLPAAHPPAPAAAAAVSGAGAKAAGAGAPAAASGAAAAAAAALPWHKQRRVMTALLGYGLIAFFYNILDEITPIFASAGVADGGLGFSPSQLAPSLMFGGLVLMTWALRGFPWLMRRVGVVRALRLGLWHTAPAAMMVPLASLFAGAWLPSQALMFFAMGAKAISGINAFTGCLIIVNAAAPVDSLGAVNGAGQSVASLVRAAGPALGGLSWAWSLQLAEQRWWPGWLPHQYLPFGVAALLALGTDLVYRGMQTPEGEEARGGGSGGGSGGGGARGSSGDT